MRSTISRHLVVPLHNTTPAYNSLRMSASRFMLFRKEVSWDSAGFCYLVKLSRENTSSATEVFSADIDDVSVWELVNKKDPPIQTESEQPP